MVWTLHHTLHYHVDTSKSILFLGRCTPLHFSVPCSASGMVLCFPWCHWDNQTVQISFHEILRSAIISVFAYQETCTYLYIKHDRSLFVDVHTLCVQLPRLLLPCLGLLLWHSHPHFLKLGWTFIKPCCKHHSQVLLLVCFILMKSNSFLLQTCA